ncbi:hypothetical protein H2198_006298 [Neophaeococcomyces mojaviensis]|uniref:Uncharacterized protein n=1 Tax=Neophaeococcomyces mojaviensis TaxID=3383035 RepID=A0ACC3A3C6_9EURO|nr:hypothetical protein H2198_006298 [Knufia sp. JES_112]
MPRDKRLNPDSTEDKKAIRRKKVRLNVQAYRQRKRTGAEAEGKGLRWIANTRWENKYDQRRRKGKLASSLQSGSPAEKSLSNPNWIHNVGNTAVTHGNVTTPSGLLISPSPARVYSSALFAMFPQRFLPTRISLPDWEDINALRTPCALWVTTAVKHASERNSGALSDIVKSVVLATIGMEKDSEDIKMYARRLYATGLAKTREHLQVITNGNQPESEKRILDLFLSCHAATVYELLVNGPMRDMLQHVLGIGLLIEHQRLLPNFPKHVGSSLLEEYRILEIHFCLLQRRLSTTSCLKSMATVADESITQVIVNSEIGLVGSLLDLADQILPLLVDLDTYSYQVSVTETQLDTIVQKASTLYFQLNAWSEFLCDQAFSTLSSSQSPVSNAHIEITHMIHYEYAFYYLYSLSYEMHAIETWIETIAAIDYRRDSGNTLLPKHSVEALPLRTQILSIAGNMLEVMPYFLQDDKGIIGRSTPIWPLEVVWSMLEKESERSKRDDAICELMPLSNELQHKLESNKETMVKYLKMCKVIAQSIHMYGLSLVVEREMV